MACTWQSIDEKLEVKIAKSKYPSSDIFVRPNCKQGVTDSMNLFVSNTLQYHAGTSPTRIIEI